MQDLTFVGYIQQLYICGPLVSIVTLQISDVSGLSHLSHLRVLNLAGNEITVVSGLFELTSLTELNLRRNRVRQVVSACMCVCRGGRWEGMGWNLAVVLPKTAASTLYTCSTYVRTYVCPNAPCPGGVCVLRLGWHKSKLCNIALAVLYVPYMPCLLCVVLAV